MTMQTVGRPTRPEGETSNTGFQSLTGGRGLLQDEPLIFELGGWSKTGVDIPLPTHDASDLAGLTRENLDLPPIYFAHEREVFRRDGMLYAVSEFVERMEGEDPFTVSVRFRTVGDMSCTGAVASEASSLADVVAEIAATRITERGETRADDRASEAAMEDRKRVGYF